MKNTLKGNFVGFTDGDPTITNSKDTIQENIIINNKKQTAVAWYVHRMYEIEMAYNQGVINTEIYVKSKRLALLQANVMEKERLTDAYHDGKANGMDISHPLSLTKEISAEEWYNETYGGNK